MFTGIIEGTGTVETITRRGDETRIRVVIPFREAFRRGESVAVDGVCLTAIENGPGWFEAVVSPETLSRTTLGQRTRGEFVNLERPLRLGDRLGGHMVQGHVDAVSEVLEVAPEGTGARVKIRVPDRLAGLIVEKGSVAVDGVSLTVAGREPGAFDVALIPETLEVTAMSGYGRGTRVNLEVDIMGRYIIEHLSGGRNGASPREVTREHLERHGFVEKGESS